MIAALMTATLAAVHASTSRHKDITLTLVPEGIMVTAVFSDSLGVPLYRYEEAVRWSQLDADAAKLEFAVRRLDGLLTERWRDQGSPQ